MFEDRVKLLGQLFTLNLCFSKTQQIMSGEENALKDIANLF